MSPERLAVLRGIPTDTLIAELRSRIPTSAEIPPTVADIAEARRLEAEWARGAGTIGFPTARTLLAKFTRALVAPIPLYLTDEEATSADTDSQDEAMADVDVYRQLSERVRDICMRLSAAMWRSIMRSNCSASSTMTKPARLTSASHERARGPHGSRRVHG